MTKPDHTIGTPRKRTLKARAAHELREFAAMFLYLLIPISLFVAHRAIALKERGIDYQFSGLAIINALVLAKVMVLGEGLGFASRWKNRPLAWPILYKSASFAVLFIIVHEVEEGLKGLIHGGGFMASIPPLGGGGLLGLVVIGLNMAIALVPFFAFRELSRVMGEGNLVALLFKHHDGAVSPAKPSPLAR
jgi:hypothetical protein